MRSGRVRIFGALILLAVLAPSPARIAAVQTSSRPADGAQRRDFSRMRSVEVESVVDSATVAVSLGGKTVKIALLGVDAPDDDEQAGRATEFLTQLLLGERVFLEPAGRADSGAADDDDAKPKKADADKPRDASGAISDGDPAYLYRVPDGLCVNAELIRQGYVRVLARPKFDQLEAFRAFEKRARDAGKGVWADSSPAPEKSAPAAGGKSGTRANDKPDAGGTAATVYVTKSGKKYHMQNCQFLTPGATALSVADAAARGLTPCSRCKPPAK